MSIELIVMLIIIGVILVGIVWSIVEKSRNNAQPTLSAEARVVAIDGRDSGAFTHSGTKAFLNLNREYRITFELLSSGERKKFYVPVKGHKTIAEGDVGVLTFQGTRYISFKRHQAKRGMDSDNSDSN